MKEVREFNKNKYPNESVVQFNVANTTPNDITIDLFKLDNLTPIPTSLSYSSLPNTLVSSFGASAYQFLAINPISGYLYVTDGSNTIQVFDTNNSNVFVTNIVVTSNVLACVYNSVDDTVYFFDSGIGRVYVVDSSTNTFFFTIIYGGGVNSVEYISATNSIYVSTLLDTSVIDCSTNTISSTLLIPYTDYVYNPTNGLVYATDNTTTVYDTINPITNTVIQSISINTNIIGNNPNLSTPFNYVVDTVTGDVYVYNWSTNNTFVTTLSPSIGNLGYSEYDPITNSVYFGSNTGNLLAVNGTNNFQTSFVTASFLIQPAINPNTNSVYFTSPITNNISQVTTTGITTTSYYVSGAVNYNFFLQNIENEPIQVYYVRLITTQIQLAKVVQVVDADASGNEKQIPHFPILGVSAWQLQGTIGFVDFKGKLILDGRTYLSDYILGANQNVTLEIHYSQLDRDSIKSILDSILPKKTPLKDVFNDYIEI